LGIVDLARGEVAAALPRLREMTRSALAIGVGEPNLHFGLPLHVEAAIAVGELDEARELLDWVEPRAERLRRAWSRARAARGRAGAARGRALLAEAHGDQTAADAAFARAYEQHERRPQQWPRYEHARTLLAHGTILRRRRRKAAAREQVSGALAIFDELGARL